MSLVGCQVGLSQSSTIVDFLTVTFLRFFFIGVILRFVLRAISLSRIRAIRESAYAARANVTIFRLILKFAVYAWCMPSSCFISPCLYWGPPSRSISCPSGQQSYRPTAFFTISLQHFNWQMYRIIINNLTSSLPWYKSVTHLSSVSMLLTPPRACGPRWCKSHRDLHLGV